MNLAKAYPGILDEYLQIARDMAREDADILKTDCFNEATGRPMAGGIAGNIPGNVRLVEIRADYVKAAKRAGLDAQLADIRRLPFENGAFDLVLDFSTIDHVRDWRPALAEYQRVMRPGARIAVVVWTMEALEHMRGQFYFPEAGFRRDFRGRFGIKEERILYQDRLAQRRRRLIVFTGSIPGPAPKKEKPEEPAKPEPKPAPAEDKPKPATPKPTRRSPAKSAAKKKTQTRTRKKG